MHTGDEYFDSKEFSVLLEKYGEAPATLDAEELTDIADYYSYIGEDDKSQEAINLATSIYPGATAPISFKMHTALSKGLVEEAQNLIEDISDKSCREYRFLKGEVLLGQGKTDESETYFRQLYAELDDDEKTDMAIDVANAYGSYSLFDLAQEWIDKIPDCDLEDYKEAKARVMLGQGKAEESIKIFNELIDINPFSQKYWNALATSQFVTGNYEEALNSSEYVLAINSESPEGLFNKANCLFHLSRFDEARTFYERYIALCPDDELGYFNLGTCLVNIDANDEAIEPLEKAKSLMPPDAEQLPVIYQELAYSYGAQAQLEKALENIELALNRSKDNHDILVLKGHILLENNKVEEAREVFAEALKSSNNDSHVFLRIIVSIYENKYVETAYRLFKTLFKTATPDFNEGYAYMALCCRDMDKPKEFLHYLILATQNNPQEAKRVLGFILPIDKEKGLPQDIKDFLAKH